MNARAIIESLTEASRCPTMAAAKRGRTKLTSAERAEVIRAGAVWPWDKKPGVWKTVVNGKTWYCCNTHRASSCKPTLKGAIKAFRFIETTA